MRRNRVMWSMTSPMVKDQTKYTTRDHRASPFVFSFFCKLYNHLNTNTTSHRHSTGDPHIRWSHFLSCTETLHSGNSYRPQEAGGRVGSRQTRRMSPWSPSADGYVPRTWHHLTKGDTIKPPGTEKKKLEVGFLVERNYGFWDRSWGPSRGTGQKTPGCRGV